ncbi:hypothetical protein Zmor_024888 [Zophobas morio]|uniref:Uncharacterized protein n=1 Tax=Zophobas morio TaxID=2755281 RepID=A0AA38HQL1_9CUCU|nr:hypothetical protein Zmor_024888 [Zophobas morio]
MEHRVVESSLGEVILACRDRLYTSPGSHRALKHNFTTPTRRILNFKAADETYASGRRRAAGPEAGQTSCNYYLIFRIRYMNYKTKSLREGQHLHVGKKIARFDYGLKGHLPGKPKGTLGGN